MRHYLNNFDDNCYELTVLRWFRDNFVFEEDIKHYYKIAPVIVEAIDKEQHRDVYKRQSLNCYRINSGRKLGVYFKYFRYVFTYSSICFGNNLYSCYCYIL